MSDVPPGFEIRPLDTVEEVFAASALLDEVWGDHVFIEERTVDVHIRRLRSALEASGHHERIETVRGTGYRFSAT